MGVVTNVGSFQGIPIQEVQYRRSPGLREEPGFVVMNLKDLKKVELKTEGIPWRPTGAKEINGQTSIQSWFTVTKGSPGGTVAKRAAELPKLEGGLRAFGDLVLSSTVDDVPQSPTVYSMIFVVGSIEEMTANTNAQRQHRVGQVRVSITDIRHYYERAGGLFCSINRRLRRGVWDRSTWNQRARKVWTAQEVISFLASQLPSSPVIHPKSDLFGLKLDPPVDIEGEGEPIIEVLEQLLTSYGLEVNLLTDNGWLVYKRGSGRVPYGQIAITADKLAPVKYVSEERKTVTYADRPVVVTVVGKRRLRRHTLNLVPVIKDLDGRWYRLSDVEKLWDYPLEKLNKQVFAGSEKQFANVPPDIRYKTAFSIKNPTAGGGTGGMLHHKRREILRAYAYKAYAPEIFFETPYAKMVGAIASGLKGLGTTTSLFLNLLRAGLKAVLAPVPSLSDADLELMPFLPIKEAPFSTDELKRDGLKKVLDMEKFIKGDIHKIQLMDPLVFGMRVGQGLFTEFKHLETYKQQLRKNLQLIAGTYKGMEKQERKKVVDALEILGRVAEATERSISKLEPGTEWFSEFMGKVGGINIGMDVRQAIQTETGVDVGLLKLYEANTNIMVLKALGMIDQWSSAVKQWRNQREQVEKDLDRLDFRIKNMKDVYEKIGGVRVKMNLPHGLLQGYSVDRKTGIVMFAEPICRMTEPFIFEGDTAEVAGPGYVQITYGYEQKLGVASDFTHFSFMAEDTDADPKVFLVQALQSSPIKAQIIRAPHMQLLETDLGYPLNMTACATEAFSKAQGILSQARFVTGYVYTLSGFHKAELGIGIDSIQYTWDGDMAQTHIAVNSPNARLPLGQPDLPKRKTAGVQRVRRRDDLASLKEELE